MKSASLSVAPSRSLLFGDDGLGPSASGTEKEQPDAANAHIQRLLDLRRKAQELSQRLSGIRSAQEAPKSRTGVMQAHLPEHAASSEDDAGSVTRSTDRPIHVPERERDACNQDGVGRSSPTKLGVEDRESEEEGVDGEAEDSDEVDSGEEEDEGKVSFDGDNDDNTNSDAMNATEEGEPIDDGPFAELQHRDTVIDAAGYDITSAMMDMSDGLDVDVRSIGVYNIAVVWPLAHEHPSVESTRRFSEVSSSAPSSSSSQSDRSANDHDE